MVGTCQACGRLLVHDRGPMCNGDVCLKTGKKWKPPKKIEEGKKLGGAKELPQVPEPKDGPPGQKPERPRKQYNFKQFTKYGYGIKPCVSIWKNNSKIHINGACLRKFKLTDVDYALLFFDEDNRAVGIRPVAERGKDTFKLIKHDYAKIIHAQLFFKTIGITFEEAQKYPVEFNEELNLLIFHLEEKGGGGL